MSKSTELLPCPFCGNSKNIEMTNEKHDHSGGYFIACPACDASTTLVYACGDDPRPILVAKWNRRAHLASQPEAAQEPVAWATGYRAGIEAAAGQFPRHLAVTQDQADFANAILRTIRDLPVTGPPADESRALLEEETKDLRTYRDAIGHFLSLALNAKSASEHEHWLYRMRDHHNRSIKDHLARSGK